MSILYIIPARGGSKGVPGKNIKSLAGLPLICYTINIAKELTSAENICVSTDDPEIVKIATEFGVPPPFLRPLELATDSASGYDVYMHALDYYKKNGKDYNTIVVLQPTSPLRTLKNVKEALALYNSNLEMVVSVKETSSNPYYVLFEENTNGFLVKSKPGNFTSRQECPPVFEYNGAVYVINVAAMRQKQIVEFTKIKKYLMSDILSIDIDTPLDWMFTEFLINKKIVDVK